MNRHSGLAMHTGQDVARGDAGVADPAGAQPGPSDEGRASAIRRAEQRFDSGAFKAVLARRLALPTESQNPERVSVLADYLRAELQPAFEAMGFRCRELSHPRAAAPFLLAERIEGKQLPTVMGYGHGDVIRGLANEWHAGLSPWAHLALLGAGMLLAALAVPPLVAHALRIAME